MTRDVDLNLLRALDAILEEHSVISAAQSWVSASLR
jgi:hypothetical protein